MASGRDRISTGPSTWTQSPQKASVNTRMEARGRRLKFLVLLAVSRVDTTTASPSTAAATSDIWGLPSRRVVESTAR